MKRCQALVVWSRASWRSTVIGWCSVVRSGQPSSIKPSMPGAEALVVVDEVELAAPGPASTLRMRWEKASGSPKPAEHMTANSVRAARSRNSRGCGTRNGSGSR